jgi:deoxyguanosine kinase
MTDERKSDEAEIDAIDAHAGNLARCGVTGRTVMLPRRRGAACPAELAAAILRRIVEFRHLAIEGPPAAGKTALADRLATRLDAALVLDEVDNPFLADSYAGRAGAAFQAQLFSVLARHRQQGALRQGDLFSQVTIADYLFDKDKIFAYLNLDDNELFIYQRLYDLLARDVPACDLVIYLQAPADVLWRRLKARYKSNPELPRLTERDLREINDAFTHFFFHYSSTPLLVVETSEIGTAWDERAIDEVLRQIGETPGGTRVYVPRA